LNIQGRNVLVLGGYGLVGMAVCRRILERRPRRLVVGSLRRWEAEAAVGQLASEVGGREVELRPAWGDLLLRAEWQDSPEGVHPRTAVLSDTERRRRLVSDILDELSEDVLTSSLLYQLILGTAPGLDGHKAEVVVDCVNTATAVAYQNVFQTASRLQSRIEAGEETNWPEEVERLLCALYVPQLVRHIQIFYEAMIRAGTQAYVKVGTSGTGGMGFNIPYTHGEERPSRMLLSKSAVAGAQTMLLFLLARTPGGPPIVKEIKPTAAIAWKEIGYGPIRKGGREIELVDCPPDRAYPVDSPATLAPDGDFGVRMDGRLESVYIDTGENGLFSVGEFTAITTLGQMEFVTPEEIADNVLGEIEGHSTGSDIVAALDSSVMGPSYRAGFLRQSALARLRNLEEQHGTASVAFEILGPPRLSKLLYEAHLLKVACGTMQEALRREAVALSRDCLAVVTREAVLRQRILSIGIPILLPDGRGLLRGPSIKAQDAEHGWVDLRPENMAHWQVRLGALRAEIQMALAEPEASSRLDRAYPAAREWRDDDAFDVGEIAGWVFIREERGRRGKS
jgi:NAD(P)-dependent dehydrogenase (short-subunit alcohol dehydrogenase family)